MAMPPRPRGRPQAPTRQQWPIAERAPPNSPGPRTAPGPTIRQAQKHHLPIQNVKGIFTIHLTCVVCYLIGFGDYLQCGSRFLQISHYMI